MAVNKHPTGGYRAYKKIFGVEHQFYTLDKHEAEKIQSNLDNKSNVAYSFKSPTLFSRCGRLVGLRVRAYKKTYKPTFQLQVTVNGKQKKTEVLFKDSFEVMWKQFFKLWREHFNLLIVDTLDYKEEIKKAKRLYMQDVYALDNHNNYH